MLEDMILHRNEFNSERRKKCDDNTELDKKLDDADIEVRIHASARMRKSTDESTGIESEKKKSKIVNVDSDDEELELLRKAWRSVARMSATDWRLIWRD